MGLSEIIEPKIWRFQLFSVTLRKRNDMVKARKYSSVEEFKEALKAAVEKKRTLDKMLRSGATKEDLESVGIKMLPIA